MSSHRLPPLWVLLAFACGVAGVWMVGDPRVKAVATSIGFVGLSALGAYECGLRTQGERRSRSGWILLGAFFGLLVLITGWQLFGTLVHGAMGDEHLSKGLLLQFTATFILLIPVSLSFARRRRRTWLEALDAAIFAVAFYLCLWIWVLRGFLESVGGDPFQRASLLAAFIAISLSAGVAMHAWAGLGLRLRHPQSWLGLGLLLFIAVAVWRVQVDLQGGFSYAHPVRLAFLPAILCFCIACRQPLEERELSRLRKGFLLALPYLPALLAFPTALAAYVPVGSERDATSFFLMGALALLLLARQALALWQIERFKATLEAKVRERTEALAQSQAIVLRTQRMNLVATLGAGVTHDLNNMLTSVIGYLDIAREELHDPAGQPGEYLERAQASLVMASGLSRRIMAAGRGERGGIPTLDLNEHLTNLAPVLKATLPRALDLQVLTLSKGPIRVKVAGAELDQVIVNLVMNARDATPEGGRVWVRARVDESGAPTLEVEDTGCGMSEEVLARIFEPFFTTKPAGQGTGLGLGSIQAVVQGLGGTLEVQSEVGRGSRFTLRFPPVEP
ncbi:MAG: HAMP domain-containing histidine kinase [Acidobacteria bacterium]|nr:HAMP domain-containing histidine kinase [Acidobacteriota bacterium]